MCADKLNTSMKQAAPEKVTSELHPHASEAPESKRAPVTELVDWIFDAATDAFHQPSRDNVRVGENVDDSKSHNSSESSEGSESESSESSFESSSSSSSGSSEPEKNLKSAIDEIKQLIEEDKLDSEQKPLRSRNEIDPSTITVPRPNITIGADDEIYPVGKIMSVLQCVAVVSTADDGFLKQKGKSHHAPANPVSFSQANDLNFVSALDCDSVLCFEDKQLLGLVDETFGPVDNPFYVVRFNSEEERDSTGATKGRTVFAVKHKSKWVKGSELQTKGYDTSNGNDEEVTATDDFSDDEEERAAKQAEKRARKREPEPTIAGSTKRRRFGQPNGTGEDRGHPTRHRKDLQNSRSGGRNFAVRQAGEFDQRSHPQHMYDPVAPSLWPGAPTTPRAAYHLGQLGPANSIHGQRSEALATPPSFKGSGRGLPQPFYGSGVQAPLQFNNQIQPGFSTNRHGSHGIPPLYPAGVAGLPNQPRHVSFIPQGTLHPSATLGSADHGLGGPGNPSSQYQYSYQNPGHGYPPPPMFMAPDGSTGRRHHSGSYYPGVSNMYSSEVYGGHQPRMNEVQPGYMPANRPGVEDARYPEAQQRTGNTIYPSPPPYPPRNGGRG